MKQSLAAVVSGTGRARAIPVVATALAASLALSTAASDPAAAVDAERFADAFVAAMALQNGATASFDRVTESGSDVRIDGLTVSVEDRTDIRFASVHASDVAEDGNGGYSAARIEFVGGTISGEATGSIGTLTAGDVMILSSAAVQAGDLPQGFLYKSGEAAGIAIIPEGKTEPVTIGRIAMETRTIVDNVPQDSIGTMTGLNVPASYFEGNGPVSLQALGYDQAVFDASWDGARDPSTQVLTLRDLSFGMRDGGTITLTGILGNVPATRMEDPQLAMAAFSQLTVHSLSLSYEDASLARRLIDGAAERQGISSEQYVAQLSAALPFFLTAVQNPGFQAEIADAVAAFLENPVSLTIELAPETPVSGAEIMGLAGTAPQTLPDRLKATISSGN